ALGHHVRAEIYPAGAAGADGALVAVGPARAAGHRAACDEGVELVGRALIGVHVSAASAALGRVVAGERMRVPWISMVSSSMMVAIPVMLELVSLGALAASWKQAPSVSAMSAPANPGPRMDGSSP